MNKIIVRAQSVDEEFKYLINIFKKMDFYNKHGYKIPIPNHAYFLNLSNNPNLLNSLNIEEAKKIFKEEIYNKKFFDKGLQLVMSDIKLIKKAIKRMKNWEKWGFKMFDNYIIKLTAYGPGGSYDYGDGSIIMKVKEDAGVERKPIHTIIHEIVHIGIEESIVEKFKLNHLEKEGLVDSICFHYFNDILNGYKIQGVGDKKIFNLIDNKNIINLPEIIENFKNND